MIDPGAAARLVLVRHASTQWSEAGRHTGRTNVPLDDVGLAAAAELRGRLADLDVVSIYSSPLKRARETCEIAGFGRAELTDALLEWDYGDYEGLTTPEIWEKRPHWELFADGCPNGESAADVGARIDLFLDRVPTAPDGRRRRALLRARALPSRLDGALGPPLARRRAPLSPRGRPHRHPRLRARDPGGDPLEHVISPGFRAGDDFLTDSLQMYDGPCARP